MRLPRHLDDLFREETGREPIVVARALYDLHGGLGSTYLAADQEWLTLYSQSGTGQLDPVSLAWPAIEEAAARTESSFAFLELKTAQEEIRLQFAAWDEPQLDAVVDLWQKHRSPTAEAVFGRKEAGPDSPGESAESDMVKPPLAPLVAFCAAIHAVIECDGEIEPAELSYLAKQVPDAQAIQQGHRFLKTFGLEALCGRLTEVLNESQRRCLMANLISVAMVDGWVRSKEVEVLDRLQAAMNLPDPERKAMFDLLMMKNNLAVFAPAAGTVASLPEADGLTPLMAYCASLRAMMEADDETTAGEEKLLHQMVPYPDDLHLGEEFLRAYGLDHLLSRLDSVLNADQKRCLLANLISVAMEDGVIRRSEQTMLDQFRRALGLGEEDYGAMYEVLLAKNNLAVFGTPP